MAATAGEQRSPDQPVRWSLEKGMLVQSLEVAWALIRWRTGKDIQSGGDSGGRSLTRRKNAASVWAPSGLVWLEWGWCLATSLAEWEPSHLLLGLLQAPPTADCSLPQAGPLLRIPRALPPCARHHAEVSSTHAGLTIITSFYTHDEFREAGHLAGGHTAGTVRAKIPSSRPLLGPAVG